MASQVCYYDLINRKNAIDFLDSIKKIEWYIIELLREMKERGLPGGFKLERTIEVFNDSLCEAKMKPKIIKYRKPCSKSKGRTKKNIFV